MYQQGLAHFRITFYPVAQVFPLPASFNGIQPLYLPGTGSY